MSAHRPPRAESGPYGLPHAHEALCRRCGVSCHAAIPVNGVPVVVPGVACRFLVRAANGRYTCSVYSERFDKAPWCRSVDEARAEGILAVDCPYVQGVPNYRGKVVLPSAQLARLAPVLRRHIATEGVPYAVSPEGALAFLQGDGSVWRAVYVEEEARTRFLPVGRGGR